VRRPQVILRIVAVVAVVLAMAVLVGVLVTADFPSHLEDLEN